MNRFLWPLVGFIVLVVLLAVGLRLNPREVPSPLVGKPAPAFALPKLGAMEQTFSPRDMQGKVWLLNVWASWCVSCRQEHPILVEIAKDKAITLVGLNYKEVRGDGGFDMDKISAETEKGMAIEEIVALLRRYDFAHQRRLSFEYIVFGGVNDSMAHARQIVSLLKGLDCRINLIRFHQIPDVPLQGADDAKMEQLRDYLTAHGIFTTIRASRGQDIFAACGLLTTAKQAEQQRKQ